jgi:ethanolamine utilization protein EutQ (cupin superfamily)
MIVRKFAIADVAFERSPGQNGDVFAGNVIDQRGGGPITIGYGRYGPDQSLEETLAVDDVMVILEGKISVESRAGSITAGPGEIVYMPKGETVIIRSHAEGAVTAYVTYPHWQEARD